MGLRRGRHELTGRQLPDVRAAPHHSGHDIGREGGVRERIRFLCKCLAGVSQTYHKHWCENFDHDVAIKRNAVRRRIMKLYIDPFYSTRVEIINFCCARAIEITLSLE